MLIFRAWATCGAAQRPGRVFAPFWSENGYRLCPFGSETGYGSRVNSQEFMHVFIVSLIISTWGRKEEKYANSKWIWRNMFCSCSNLSNDKIVRFLETRSKPTGMKWLLSSNLSQLKLNEQQTYDIEWRKRNNWMDGNGTYKSNEKPAWWLDK